MARTRARDYDEKRAAILRASARAFAKGGVDRTSMSQIAAACKVSKALLYHYYESKEELIYDIIHDHLDQLLTTLVAVDDPGAAPEQRLRALIGATLNKYSDGDDQHKIQIEALPKLPADRAETIRDVERAIVRKFSDAIAAVNPALGGGDPRLAPTTMSLFGIVNWAYMWFRPNGPMSRSDYADLTTKLFIGGIKSL
ncbi:MAG: TetR/AcrR family transcriptional regulator [Neomegalonema sp.]|nr:TetR/AcrR family transcriptional regulator [Neomegalonema sp.]